MITSGISGDLEKFRTYFKQSIRTDVVILDQIIRYLLRQKGKELRPTLVFMSARLFGKVNDRSYVAATMIELMHTATLIHDDVVDEADSRRGFLSINKLWRNKAGVLLGDFLLAKGLLIALDNKEYELLQVLSKAVEKMSEGELRQLKTAKLANMTEERYYQIISEKTASLIASCCKCGAISTSGNEDHHELMHRVGHSIGMAFQIRDDLFDYELLDVGKPTRNDIQERKFTLPLIHALRQSDASSAKDIRAVMKKRKKSKTDVNSIVDFVHENGGMEYAKTKMHEFAKEAIDLLEGVPDSTAKNRLIDLVSFIIHRNK